MRSSCRKLETTRRYFEAASEGLQRHVSTGTFPGTERFINSQLVCEGCQKISEFAARVECTRNVGLHWKFGRRFVNARAKVKRHRSLIVVVSRQAMIGKSCETVAKLVHKAFAPASLSLASQLHRSEINDAMASRHRETKVGKSTEHRDEIILCLSSPRINCV